MKSEIFPGKSVTNPIFLPTLATEQSSRYLSVTVARCHVSLDHGGQCSEGSPTEPRNSQKVVNIGEQIAQPANIVIVYAKSVRPGKPFYPDRADRSVPLGGKLRSRKYSCKPEVLSGRVRDERAEQSGQSCCLVKCSISMDPMILARLNKLNVVMQMLRYTSSQTI